MARQIGLSISGINIVTHPHSPERYVDLFKSLYSLKLSRSIRTTQRIMLGELSRIDDSDLTEGIFGRIYKFDQIDPNMPWFNVETNEVATDEELAAISIPESLKPNFTTFDFVFYPKTHKFFFTSSHKGKHLSAGVVKRLFEYLIEHPAIRENFGKVEITIIPDQTQLENIFNIYNLRKLEIDVVLPNPDDNEEDEREIFSRLERQNARRIKQVIVAEPRESIEPDEETKKLARVAASNGKVIGTGYTQTGEKIEESTTKTPWSNQITYDPDTEIPALVLIQNTRP
ncbi:DUF4747 family protein [Methylovorus menthalis]|uniref:DUF4747 family protein n=1 Tax=Methylovorus menthalis TaxID=1002227 RepID=UPI001E5C0221|nr:DUF4747 family protein [Methylovorus menthalis]MCB4809701.1 DUF4747 family protein [Methylovorus menthalis]